MTMIILETCGLWDIDYNSDNWELEFMTIFPIKWTNDPGIVKPIQRWISKETEGRLGEFARIERPDE